VARLADPTTGRVTIDDIDLRDIAPATLAALVGVVSQETYLLHDSIAANLRFAKPDATDAELWQALEIAQIDELVARLPAGLDTVVGSRGQRFSGGEQQRLAIARTVLRDPRIIVLDEATSALDNDTERELQAALDALSDGRTTLTIAHRLSTIRDADQIAVLDHGRIVEMGTHIQLVERGGRYAQLAATKEIDRPPVPVAA
jgi:ATP-binding cassette subfamily B protein